MLTDDLSFDFQLLNLDTSYDNKFHLELMRNRLEELNGIILYIPVERFDNSDFLYGVSHELTEITIFSLVKDLIKEYTEKEFNDKFTTHNFDTKQVVWRIHISTVFSFPKYEHNKYNYSLCETEFVREKIKRENNLTHHKQTTLEENLTLNELGDKNKMQDLKKKCGVAHIRFMWLTRANKEFYYHGTQEYKLNSILKFGLLPSEKTHNSNYKGLSKEDSVYITSDFHLASCFAVWNLKLYHNNEKAFVLKIKKSAIAHKKLIKDENIGYQNDSFRVKGKIPKEAIAQIIEVNPSFETVKVLPYPLVSLKDLT